MQGQIEHAEDRKRNTRAHVLDEMQTPSLLLRCSFSGSLEADKEFALKVDELVEIREQIVNLVLCHDVPLCEGSCISLRAGSNKHLQF